MAEDSRSERNGRGPAPLLPLIAEAKARAFDEMHRRLVREGHGEVREGHGCVFQYIDLEGSRLTTLAERSRFSKQAVGEIVDDLERLAQVERVPDPSDRRAKIIRLTPRGAATYEAGLRIFAELEREWAERFGAERVATLRAVLEELVAEEAEEAAEARPAAAASAVG